MAERADAVSPLSDSTLALPLSVDLTVLEPMLIDVLNHELPLRQKEWTRVTAEGANPQVETRMQARVDTLTLRIKRGTLRIVAKVVYFGKVRAQLATPFGKAWLSHGTDWGTEQQPGVITLSFELSPGISRKFELSTRTTLERVSFDAPKGDALCGRIVIKVCVPREQAAKEVHAQLKRAIEEVSPKLLSELDRRVAQKTDLAAAVALTVQTLEHPAPALDGSTLSLGVKRVALGALGGAGARASLPLELTVQTSFGAQPAGPPHGLLEREDTQGLQTDLTFDAQLTFKDWSRSLSQGLASFEDGSFRFHELELLGVGRQSGRIVAAVRLWREQESLTLYAEAEPAVRADAVVLTNLKFLGSSRSALRSLGLNEQKLLQALNGAALVSLSSLAQAHVESVRRKLAAPLVFFGTLALSTQAVQSMSAPIYTTTGLSVRLHVPARAELR